MAYTDIDKPTDYFNTVLYTGNGSARTITGVGFQPDWVWVKDRSSANYHYLYDSVRGNNLNLFSNDYSVEVNVTTGQNGGGIGSQASDGFTIVAGVVNTNNVNTNTNLYASWNWLAGGTASSNTDGSITSSVSANTTSGFSIVSYTANGTQPSTVGHGLGVIPQVVLVKPRSDAQSWCMYHESIGNTKLIYLDSISTQSGDDAWNNTSPTSSVFTVNDTQVNSGSNTYIAYCFAEKKGFSKFGSYVGNGSSDGSFIYTGFKPAFVMHKRTDTTNNWIMQDNKRVGYNADNRILKANLTDAEQGVHEMDFVSNGFKIRTTGAGSNASGGSYIYMAFAENPFVTSTGIPTTAR